MLKKTLFATAAALTVGIGAIAVTATPAAAHVSFGFYFGAPYYSYYQPYYYPRPYYYQPYYYQPYYYYYNHPRYVYPRYSYRPYYLYRHDYYDRY